jgi:uncharacterized membrane protein
MTQKGTGAAAGTGTEAPSVARAETARWGEKNREAALNDPLRSSGGMHEAGRFQRGIAEFLRMPLLITGVFCVAGVGLSLLDLGEAVPPVRDVAEAMVPGKGATDFVSAVATSLLTVTSITFSVLLLAVQQTASSLTTVVFDQFLRRASNRIYFGFFVGLTAFTFIVFGLAREKPAPVLGAAVTLVLTVVALVVLLMLIHSTIDQMRPQSVVRSIHELALRARERELVLLGRTRPERTTDRGTTSRAVRVRDSGYVVTLDIDALAAVARRVGPEAEVVVEGRLGEYVIFGDAIAHVVGADADDESYDEDVLSAVGLDDIRDVEVESGYAIDQLENIAWATGTSAGQSPNTAITAIRSLRDLVGRWLIAGERDRSDRSERPDELPIVYVDGAVNRILVSFSTLVVASSESRQVRTCAELLLSFARLAPRLESRLDIDTFDRALDASLPAVIQHAEVPLLRDALDELVAALEDTGHDASRVVEVRELLAEATRRLLPKPSDEPDAAHPV